MQTPNRHFSLSAKLNGIQMVSIGGSRRHCLGVPRGAGLNSSRGQERSSSIIFICIILVGILSWVSTSRWVTTEKNFVSLNLNLVTAWIGSSVLIIPRGTAEKIHTIYNLMLQNNKSQMTFSYYNTLVKILIII